MNTHFYETELIADASTIQGCDPWKINFKKKRIKYLEYIGNHIE